MEKLRGICSVIQRPNKQACKKALPELCSTAAEQNDNKTCVVLVVCAGRVQHDFLDIVPRVLNHITDLYDNFILWALLLYCCYCCTVVRGIKGYRALSRSLSTQEDVYTHISSV